MLPITATFIDEISHDIPHQNWGPEEWDRDFSYMQKMGIDTVVLIRSGYKKWLTYPSPYLVNKESCFPPYTDLLRLFLQLADKYNMSFYFGLYDSGTYWWDQGNYQKEVDINRYVIDEVWKEYGQYPAFKGWYITQEVSHKIGGIIDLYRDLAGHCKQVSQGLRTIISPYIDGKKAILSKESQLSKDQSKSVKEHENTWNEILEGIKEVVDILAFQDGHVDFDELETYLQVNKALADKHGLESWTNSESFDRDMPIKFLPIKWDKLRMKLEAAQQAGMIKGITFEFSHFMSPQSSYLQARHLYDRYMEHLKTIV